MSRKQSAPGPRRTISARTVREARAAPVTAAHVRQAAESWLIPVICIVAAAVFWALAAFEVWSDATAVLAVGTSLLVLTMFASFQQHFFSSEPRTRWICIGFAILWSAFVLTSFYAHDFPGAPVATGVLEVGGQPLALPQAGRYAVVVDGHFIATDGQGNRLGHYRLDAVSGGEIRDTISGNFEDSFARQRLGRRGSTVVEVQHTAQRHIVTVAEGTTIRAAEIDRTLDPTLRVVVYPAVAPWIFPMFGLAGLAFALALEKWLDGDGSATMGVAVSFFTVDQYLRWASPHPQMKTLIGFVLVGGIIGAPLAAILWRIVPRRWVVARG
jgi:hypothetical protein